jgi:hypothetical protein
VTQLVTTTPGPSKPSATAPDCRSALTCGNQTCADRLRRNRCAWHATAVACSEQPVAFALDRPCVGVRSSSRYRYGVVFGEGRFS